MAWVERAGNAALEEIVMTVHTRSDVFDCTTSIDTRQIVPISRLVAGITGFPVQPNKAIVGANAFAHESGIHQDGVLKYRETYEIMRSEDVGWSSNRIVLGKHSGRNAFKTRLQELGVTFSNTDDLNDAFERFKLLADKKEEIYDEDLQALVSDSATLNAEEYYRLDWLNVTSESGTQPCAKITLRVEDAKHQAEAQGSGPVDAAFKAIESVAQSGGELLLYSVNNITTGTDSQGEVTVRLSRGGRVVNGLGVDTDIVIASAKAYVNALNKLSVGGKAHPQLEHI